MRRIALQSIVVGLSLSLGLMVVASLGLLSPPVGAVLQEGLDAAVILNALRVRQP
jgi:cation transport ATPase